ncbi:MAG: DUF551 domain-containing protein [Acetobacter orientalis]|uniref:DUF551 domain-containing protein n=1 Tax=Acetobacter orientalis TaxID=146474 RepID=UPI0039E8F9C2
MTDPRIEAAARAICAEFMKDGKAVGAARLCTQDAFIDLARVALAAADTAAWRPMSEAPKDGTRILILKTTGRVSVALFADDDWQGDDCYCYHDPDFLTHWQPLPTPPNATPQADPGTITIPEVRNDRPIPGKEGADG